MEAHYPRYLLYGLLIIGSWLLSCLLHFQFVHFTLCSASRRHGGAALVVLPVPVVELDGRDQGGALRRLSSSEEEAKAAASRCEGRYVYMVEVPSRFDVLSGCVEGSPAFEDEYSVCVLASNAGLGPVIAPSAGNDTDGDDGVIPSTGWYSTDQYALEVIVHNRMRRYECLTDDPAAATAVYVPYYPGLELHQHLCGYNTTVRDWLSTEFLRWLSSRPQWAALGGRDHFMVAAKTTWMFRRVAGATSPGEKGCGNNFLDHPETANMTVLTYESNIWARRDFAVPYPSYFHPTSAGELAAWQDRARGARRPWLLAFAGARRQPGALPIRDRIIDSCTSSPRRCGIVDCSNGLEGSITCRTPRKLVALFASSRFCLQPRGDSFMRRSSVDAIIAGCIPVFFHDASTFKKQYRWHEPDINSAAAAGDDDDRRYSVLIDPDELMEGKVDIEEVLARFTDGEVAAMREEVIKMIPRFLYKDPRVRFQGQMRDAFDIAIDRVMARMRRIKSGKDSAGWNDDPDEDDDHDDVAAHKESSHYNAN